MKVFCHHIYEYKKGIRKLILHTLSTDYRDAVEQKLLANGISYTIQVVNDNKINVFFGADECIRVIDTFVHKSLTNLTPEEDFILGTLLGYDALQQCKRYNKKREEILIA